VVIHHSIIISVTFGYNQMSTGGKRKRAVVKEFCTNCSKDGGNGAGHTVLYCAFLGGSFYNAADPDAGKKEACRIKHRDETTKKRKAATMEASKKADQFSLLSEESEAKDVKLRHLADGLYNLQRKVDRLGEFIQSVMGKLQQQEQRSFTSEIKGKGKGKGSQ
jgi:hypothetical protein